MLFFDYDCIVPLTCKVFDFRGLVLETQNNQTQTICCSIVKSKEKMAPKCEIKGISPIIRDTLFQGADNL